MRRAWVRWPRYPATRSASRSVRLARGLPARSGTPCSPERTAFWDSGLRTWTFWTIIVQKVQVRRPESQNAVLSGEQGVPDLAGNPLAKRTDLDAERVAG